MGRKAHMIRFRSVAQAIEAKGLSDTQAAVLCRCDRSLITKLRRGQKFRSLRRPLVIARVLQVPIESLAPADGA